MEKQKLQLEHATEKDKASIYMCYDQNRTYISPLCIKTPSVFLRQLPMARPSAVLTGQQILAAYGISDELLAKLLQIRKDLQVC